MQIKLNIIQIKCINHYSFPSHKNIVIVTGIIIKGTCTMVSFVEGFLIYFDSLQSQDQNVS